MSRQVTGKSAKIYHRRRCLYGRQTKEGEGGQTKLAYRENNLDGRDMKGARRRTQVDGIGKEAPSSPSSLYVYGQDDWVRGDEIDGEGKKVVPAASDWKEGCERWNGFRSESESPESNLNPKIWSIYSLYVRIYKFASILSTM